MNARFEVQIVQCEYGRAAVNDLVRRIYQGKGYVAGLQVSPRSTSTTFLAVDEVGGQPLGTISVAMDSHAGIQADLLYAKEVNRLRDTGGHVCEMTRFAIDGRVRSRQVLYALFENAFIHAYEVGQADELLIEVNPTHAPFYERYLSFEVWGPTHLNPRVNAPGTLLRLNMHHAAARMGKKGRDSSSRSVLPSLKAPKRRALSSVIK